MKRIYDDDDNDDCYDDDGSPPVCAVQLENIGIIF
jgi:hypothetical protein